MSRKRYKASKAEKKRAANETQRITAKFTLKWQRFWKKSGIQVWYCLREERRQRLQTQIDRRAKQKPTKRNDMERTDHR